MSTVQSPQAFVEDFITSAKQAKERIYIQSMIFERGDVLNAIEPVVLKKVKEGVDVRVTIDWIARRYVHDDLFTHPPLKTSVRKYNALVHKQNRALIKRWKEHGVTFTITNIPNSITSPLTIFRRNHIKLFVVDDTAAWIGGVNLFDVSMEWLDFMVKFTDRTTIKAISDQFHKVNEKRAIYNYSVQCTPENKLLVDAGKIGDSIIYNEAIDCVKQAKHSIIFTSQFLPDHDILRELLRASQRGITITVITSNEQYKLFHSYPYKYFYDANKRKIEKSSITLAHQATKVHAKLIIVDDKVAMFGSHNFIHSGVILGTEEIAMRTEEPELVKQLKKFIEENTKI